jgi:beta-glucosidase
MAINKVMSFIALISSTNSLCRKQIEMSLCKNCFGSDFAWGVSTAAYQIEGAYMADGKGLSIWDVFTNTKGKVRLNENANIACDFYHRYTQDLATMHLMNISNYRFSISWSRILPNGTTDRINKAGIDFYNRLIDFCLELNITPWITLYHWDLPYELEKKGGWNNRQVLDWFNDYVAFCIRKFGDRVKHWMVLNEPMVFTGAGHFLGIHAPGKRGISTFLSAAHHAALCQAEGGRIIKSLRGDCKVGTTFSCSLVEPFTQQEGDVAAAAKVDALLNRMFIEPLLGMSYPAQTVRLLQRMEQYMHPGDEQKLAVDMDFIGVQNYTREMVRYSMYTPFVQAQIVKAEKRQVTTTSMNWEVYPECIY